MIALDSDCLYFELSNGEKVPLSAANICVEISGDYAHQFDAEFVRHAANAVFHYFRYEKGHQTVSVAEFAEALEKVLSGFTPRLSAPGQPKAPLAILDSDLFQLAAESGQNAELFFFPRLRAELRRQMNLAPRVVRFHGLRSCVKRLAGARRWSPRCRNLHQQIVDFLRGCLNAEPTRDEFALVVR